MVAWGSYVGDVATVYAYSTAQAFEEVGLPPVRAFAVFSAMDKSDNNNIDRIEWLHVIEEAARGSQGCFWGLTVQACLVGLGEESI